MKNTVFEGRDHGTENKRRFRARFAPEANNFVSLVNLATGDGISNASAPQSPLVELYALADGEKKKLLPGVAAG